MTASTGSARPSNPSRYGGVAIALHWISAVAIFVMLGTGFTLAYSIRSPWTAPLLTLHIAGGIVTLALTLFRLVWRISHRAPAAVPGQPRWQAIAATSVHGLLYGAVTAMGLSGVGLLVLSRTAIVSFFTASGPMPDFAELPPMTVHMTVALALASLVGLHVGAAFHHHFFRRDAVLSRMGIAFSGKREAA